MADRTCQNWAETLVGAFCHRCGQRDRETRRALWTVLAEALSEALELDGRLGRTAVPFFFRPGFLIREYVEGRRQQYTSPVRIFVFSLAMGFLALTFAGDRAVEHLSEQVGERPVEIVDGEVVLDVSSESGGDASVKMRLDPDDHVRYARQLSRVVGRPTREAAAVLLASFFDALPSLVVLVLVPYLTLLLEIAFPRFMAIEHLLLSLHVHSIALLLGGALALVGYGVGWLVFGVVVPLYLGAAIWRLFPKSRVERLAKFGWVAAMYLVGVLAVTVATLVLAFRNL